MSEWVDLLGHALIRPQLNLAEYDYLTAFAQSSRTASDDPYEVPANPAAVRGRGETGPVGRLDDSWCPWAPAAGGRVLAPSGSAVGQGSGPRLWLRYLLRHFLAKGGLAGRARDPRFAEFSFDHVLEGAFVTRSRRSGRMCVIRVRANRIRQQVLDPGDPDLELSGPLPYEDELDRLRLVRERRRRVGTPVDLVYPAVGRAR